MEKEIKQLIQQLDQKIDTYIEENEKKDLEIKTLKEQEKKLETENIKAFKIFDNFNKFIDYVENLYNVKYWFISSDSYEERASKLKDSPYYSEIKNEFNSKNLLNKKITHSQLVSFFDTMFLMHAIIKAITNKELINECSIIMECVIPGTAKERIDYALCFRNQILLLEFSKANSIDDIKKVDKEKTEQVNRYQQNLKKYLSNQIEITTQTCIYVSTLYYNEKQVNINACANVTKIINNLVKRTYPNAINELNKINEIN